MTTSAYSDLIGRAEKLVKAHMAKYVIRYYPFVVANGIELSVLDMTLRMIGHTVGRLCTVSNVMGLIVL